ncbi:MAG: sulfur carrier protein ThiS [Candidatus Sumerlaeia bacterium]|nr:sulfur carrier protein ThiS [Candidatus Sumerlaeia bacterium]
MERDTTGTRSIVLNGDPHEAAAATLAELLDELQLGDRPVATLVNDEIVRRADRAGRVLSAGDRVEVVSMVGGG